MTPKRTRRRYTAEFKAEVALAVLTERLPLAELAARYLLAPAQITRWKGFFFLKDTVCEFVLE